jgi:hypothetical protein
MEFLKNISIYDKNLLDCFDEKGYCNEVIGVYSPKSDKIFDYIKNYQDLGFRFLIYRPADKKITTEVPDLDLKVETDFRQFYKKIDMFIIESLADYHFLIDDLAGMKEKIYVFDD